MNSKSLEEEFPLHWLVWHNRYQDLDVNLAKDLFDKESIDARGRTPLHLAVTLGHIESAKVLLRFGANSNAENKGYWTVLHEAVSSGDPELAELILKHRDYQRYTKRSVGVPELLQKLKESQDFYVEMKWEFTSWVPLISRMCPNDTYRVWKSGSNVRVDTTLLGFDNMNWQRGSRSYIFKGSADSAMVMEVDHDRREVFSETMQLTPVPPDLSIMEPSQEAIVARLTSPVMTTYVDTEKICFERNKSGIWGWRSDKTEDVNKYPCKVFGAQNVELITKSRMEHLTEQDKERSKKNNKTPLESFLGVAEEHSKAKGASNGEVSSVSFNPCSITPEEYFNKTMDLGERDIGRPLDQTTKTQKFKATLWLCEAFPLSLQEQVIPIIDLMAASNPHFKKLRDFITLQLPAGFPVKIEIPLLHVLNARITFGNIFSCEEGVDGVTVIKEEEEPVCCVVDESCFDPPPSYGWLGDGHHERLRDEDDELLQFAIQQSLMEAGTENDQVTFWEALNKDKKTPRYSAKNQEDRQLQRAIAESIALSTGQISVVDPPETQPSNTFQEDEEEELRLVMQLSQSQVSDDEKRRLTEDEELERILQLSLTEK